MTTIHVRDEAVRRLAVAADPQALDPPALEPHWRALHAGELDALELFAGGVAPAAVLPGAFNPLHRGHLAMAASAAQRLGGPVGFEISVANVDKPGIELAEAVRRLAQFRHRPPVWLTRAPTFVDKARLFPGTTFVVGADTIERIGDERYYAGAAGLAAALAALEAHGVRFLVFGRAGVGGGETGRFRTLAGLRIPPRLGALCEEVPEAQFRVDLSSTELRARGEAPP